MKERSNAEWVAELKDNGSERQRIACFDLSHYLHQIAWTYSQRRADNLPGLLDLDQAEREHLTQEFAQEALLRIYQNLDQYSGRGSFLAWASTVVRRVAGEILRKSHWQSPRFFSMEGMDDEVTKMFDRFTYLVQSQDDASLPHEQKLQLDEMMQVVGQVVENGLSPRQRFAFLERFVNERTHEEIAARLESNRDAVHQLIHQARLKIKRALAEAEYSAEDL